MEKYYVQDTVAVNKLSMTIMIWYNKKKIHLKNTISTSHQTSPHKKRGSWLSRCILRTASEQ